MVSHTYRAAGNYTVTCTVYEPSSGKSDVATYALTVDASDQYFPTTDTIFVDPDSDWINAPIGATTSTTFDAAVAAVKGQDITPKRIILNRGKTFSFSGSNLGSNNSGNRVPILHIVAGSGGGANPIVNCTGGFSWDDNQTTGTGSDKDLVFQDIDFYGGWNPVTETGTKIDFLAVYGYSPNLTLIDGCRLDAFNVDTYITSGTTTAHRVVVLNDSTLTNWRDYAAQEGGCTAYALIGSSVIQNPDALAGGPKDGTHNEHSPFRQGTGDRMIIDASEVYSLSGWPASYWINYDAETSAFTKGLTLTGGTSGATATISAVRDDGTTGKLSLDEVSTLFIDNETITDSATGSATANGPSQSFQAIQPCVRFNASGQEGAKGSFQRSMFEGGTDVVTLGVQDGSTPAAVNFIMEKCTIVGSHITRSGLKIPQGGVTCRNNIFIQPDAKVLAGSQNPEYFVSNLNDGGDATNTASPVEIYNNTFVDLMSDANYTTIKLAKISENGARWTNYVDQNNILHQPNTTTGTTTYAPLADSTSLWFPYSNGYQDYLHATTKIYSAGSPDYVIDYDAETGTFTSGLVLTGGTSGATARILSILDDGTTGKLYLKELSGAFTDNETITDSSTGSATANGPSRDAAQICTYAPLTGSAALNPGLTGEIAYDDFYGTVRPSAKDRGAIQVST